jgi:hypothetical protein
MATRKTASKGAHRTAPAAALDPGAAVISTCDDVERYLDRLLATKIPGLHVQEQVLRPQKPSAIDAAEKKLGAPFPADVRAFLQRGLRHPHGGTDDEPAGLLGFDFLPADKVVKITVILRQAAGGDPGGPHAALVHRGVALTWSEPQLLVASGGVYHFSYRNPVLRVASSWSDFLASWLAAGCFSSHAFAALWKKVGPVSASDVPPGRNPWVKAYRKQFPGQR